MMLDTFPSGLNRLGALAIGAAVAFSATAIAGEFDACGVGAGNCLEDNGTPGCDPDECSCFTGCCAEVCTLDPYCCEVEWDQSCVDTAESGPCVPAVYFCGTQHPDAPENDCCDTPMEVDLESGGTFFVDFDHANTDGPEDPANPCFSAEADADVHNDSWYLVRPDADGILTASTCGLAQLDTKIAAYDLGEGVADEDLPVLCSPTTLAGRIVACNEDCEEDMEFYSSTLAIGILQDHVYLVRVGTYLAEEGTGEVSFAFEPALVLDVENDFCENAIEIRTGPTPFSNIGATTDGPSHAACEQYEGFGHHEVYNDIWFTWEATTTGEVTFSTCLSADFDTKIAVYETTDCDTVSDQTLLGCADWDIACGGSYTTILDVDVVQGQGYLVRVGGFDVLWEGAGVLNVYAPPSACETPLAPSTADVLEAEACGADVNGGCNMGPDATFEDVVAGETVHGTFWADGGARDTDWYRILVDDPDGSGQAKLCVNLAAAGPLSALVVSLPDGDCSQATLVGAAAHAGYCDAEFQSNTPVVVDAPGEYVVFVAADDSVEAPGTDAVTEGFACGGYYGNDYQLGVSVLPIGEACNFVGSCPADLNVDGVVDSVDLAILLGAWGDPPGGSCTYPVYVAGCPADLNMDYAVDSADIAILLGAWGDPPTGICAE